MVIERAIIKTITQLNDNRLYKIHLQDIEMLLTRLGKRINRALIKNHSLVLKSNLY